MYVVININYFVNESIVFINICSLKSFRTESHTCDFLKLTSRVSAESNFAEAERRN